MVAWPTTILSADGVVRRNHPDATVTSRTLIEWIAVVAAITNSSGGEMRKELLLERPFADGA